ncbi:hypothetical protein M1L60_05355 [Actinoplanes sp. TRM 88003]|uniref:Uncharacterized protein n=1 Tax=Paractinoplanes aksuensis TaxID=2939490 RepID=A0ABT1DGP7_9ACTN|nr:hypothetical protein [Actinoplanes aksuensis]MCO8270018.1 hypothetical protein [Actinoplanes aksuensis]
MTDTEIRDVLNRAAGDVSPAPDLLDRVRAGGRRRVIRRRTAIGGALAVVAGAGLAPLARRGDGPLPVDDRVRGDLAGDLALVGRVRKAYGEGTRVRWIGRTPGGPVAAVTGPSGMRDGYDLQSFVETVDGELRPVDGATLVPEGTVQPAAMLAGPDRDVLVVFTGGSDVMFSGEYRIDAGGRVGRTFEPLIEVDGAVVRPIPDPGRFVPFALRSGGSPDKVWLANMHTVADDGSNAQNLMPERIDHALPGRAKAWADEPTGSEKDWWDVGAQQAYLDPYGYHAWTGPTQWRLSGSTADGRRLVVQTLALDGRARAFWLAAPPGEKPRVNYLGRLEDGLSSDATDGFGLAYPILHARLPQELGVAVAALNCQLLFRVRREAWLPVAGSAAVIPAAATELEVRPRRGQAVRVRLP